MCLDRVTLDLRLTYRSAQCEDEDPGKLAVEHHGGIARVGVGEPGQFIELGLVVDVQPMLLDGALELHRLEEIVGARAGEDGDAVCQRAKVFGHPALDPLDIAVIALPVGAPGLEGAAPCRQLQTEEPVYVVPPMLGRLSIQIEANDWKCGRGKTDQTFELALQQRRHASSSTDKLTSGKVQAPVGAY